MPWGLQTPTSASAERNIRLPRSRNIQRSRCPPDRLLTCSAGTANPYRTFADSGGRTARERLAIVGGGHCERGWNRRRRRHAAGKREPHEAIGGHRDGRRKRAIARCAGRTARTSCRSNAGPGDRARSVRRGKHGGQVHASGRHRSGIGHDHAINKPAGTSRRFCRDHLQPDRSGWKGGERVARLSRHRGEKAGHVQRTR